MTLRPLTWLVIACAALALVVFLVLDEGVEAPPAPPATATPAGEPEPATASLAEPSAPHPVREESPATPEAAARDPDGRAAAEASAREAPASDATLGATIRGLVLDPAGRPVAGVRVGPAGREERAESDAAGGFALELPATGSTHVLTLFEEDLVALCGSRITATAGAAADSALVVAAPAVSVAGRAVDADGTPVGGARVTVEIAVEPLLHDFPRPIDETVHAQFTTTSGGDGSWSLGPVPAAGSEIVARREGYRAARAEVPELDTPDLVLVLEEGAGAEPARVRGTVLLPDGAPAEGALVRYHRASGRTDARGGFELDHLPDVDADVPLAAALEGFGPAVLERFGELLRAAAPDPPPPLTLVLGPEPLAIAGRVVDAAGEPLEGWIVRLARGTPVSRGRVPPVLAENLAGFPPRVSTGADGAFAIDGLLDRAYVLSAHDPDTLLSVESDAIPAGTEDAEVRVGAELLHPRVSGRVVSRAGTPVEGASVFVGLYTARSGGATSWTLGRHATTDADGRFELADVPRAGVFLEVRGEGVIPERFDVEPTDDPGFRLAVARRAHFRVTVTNAGERPLAIEVADATGERGAIYRFQAGGWSSSVRHALDGGRSGILSASEDAVELRVLSEGEVVATRPLALDPALEVVDVELALP